MEETNSNKHKFQKVPNEQRDVLLKYHNWDHRHRLLKLEWLFIQTNSKEYNCKLRKCKYKLLQIQILAGANKNSYKSKFQKVPNEQRDVLLNYHDWDHRHGLLTLERLLTNKNKNYNKYKHQLWQIKIPTKTSSTKLQMIIEIS